MFSFCPGPPKFCSWSCEGVWVTFSREAGDLASGPQHALCARLPLPCARQAQKALQAWEGGGGQRALSGGSGRLAAGPQLLAWQRGV